MRSTTSARGTSSRRFRPRCSREAARAGRRVHVIAESNQNDVRLVRPPSRGGYGLDGVWSDDFHHSVHALLTGERDGYYLGFRRAGAGGQGAQRRVRVRRLLQPLSPPPPRQPRGRARPHAVRRLHPEPRPGGQSRRAAIAWHARSARRAAAGVRLAVALAVRAAVVHGGGIRRRAALSLLLLVRRSGLVEAVRRGRREEFAALAFQWGAEIPDPQDPADLCRGQARLGMAGRLAAGATPATVSGPAGGPPPLAGAPRPAADRPVPGCCETRIADAARCCAARRGRRLLAVANLARGPTACWTVANLTEPEDLVCAGRELRTRTASEVMLAEHRKSGRGTAETPASALRLSPAGEGTCNPPYELLIFAAGRAMP